MKEELKTIINCDIARYSKQNLFGQYMNSSLRITKAYRKVKYSEERYKIRLIYNLRRLKYHCLCRKYGYDVPSHVTIGKGLAIYHPNGIVINSLTVIGDYFTIAGGAKIGITEAGKGAVIGNNVTMGINSCIIGNLHIGDNVVIGAGSVVTKDVPANAVVAGNPAKIIKYLGE